LQSDERKPLQPEAAQNAEHTLWLLFGVGDTASLTNSMQRISTTILAIK
jgi:hypothetical protein